jgi:glycerol-3-phosphate acyltransferase PlsY
LPRHEIFFLVFSYFLGAIPFGYILCYLTDKKDIRQEGSGNIGATNVLRIKGKALGLITLALDILKGVFPILYGSMHFDSPVLIIGGGGAAILGHLYSVYLKFKGGKGVSTFLGMIAVFHFTSALVFGTVFIFTYFLFKYISASSIAGVAVVFFVILFTNVMEVSIIVFMIALLIIIKHRGNIKRIIDGTESQLIWKKNG